MKQKLKQALSHVLWIGGGTDAGKTTVAGILAKRYGFQLYHYDHHNLAHDKQLAQVSAFYQDLLNVSMEERWVIPEPKDLVERALRIFQDRHSLVIEDLLGMEKEPVIISEGFGFTPELILPLLSSHNQAVWLVPSESFKWASMKRRGKFTRRLTWSDPERAVNNLFTRDMLLVEQVRQQVETYGLTLCEVDGSRSIEEMVKLVGRHFEMFLSAATTN